MARSINIVYFAWVRERLGIDQEQVPLDDEIKSIADVLAMLAERDSRYADIFADSEKLRFALDQDYGLSTSLIGSAKELAIFPPVTGG